MNKETTKLYFDANVYGTKIKCTSMVLYKKNLMKEEFKLSQSMYKKEKQIKIK